MLNNIMNDDTSWHEYSKHVKKLGIKLKIHSQNADRNFRKSNLKKDISEDYQKIYSKLNVKYATTSCTILREIDSEILKKIKKGKLPFNYILDLHGLTQNSAYVLVKRTIYECYNAQKRLLLIITGKGNILQGGGILWHNFQKWITDEGISQYVIGISCSADKHGGRGAFYLLLKKIKIRA